MSDLEYPKLRGRVARRELAEDRLKVIADNLGDDSVFRDRHYTWKDSHLGHYSRGFNRGELNPLFPNYYNDDSSGDSYDTLTLLMEKNDGAPEELPSLSKYDIFRMKKD
jgi:hypothetical protein